MTSPLAPLQDVPLLQQGQGCWRLLSAGLCNSGLAATWLCCAALTTCGRLLEAGSGQLQLLAMFLLCCGCASAAHVAAGRCAVCVAAPGAVLGMYAAWTLVAAQQLRGEVPLRLILSQGLLLAAALLALGLVQPAVGVASLAGGAAGGLLAPLVTAPLSRALRWGLTLPLLCALIGVRVGFDALKLLWLFGVFVAASVYELGRDVVQAVRRL